MLTDERRDEMLALIDEAEGFIIDAIDALKTVANETDDDFYRRTIVANLEIMIGAGSWLGRDPTLDEWRKALELDPDDEDYEEEESDC